MDQAPPSVSSWNYKHRHYGFGYLCKAKSQSNHGTRPQLFFYSDLAVITHPPPASLFWSLQRANTNNANNGSLHLGDLSESTKPFHINDLKPWVGDRQEGVTISVLPRKKIKDQKDKIIYSKSKMISRGNQCWNAPSHPTHTSHYRSGSKFRAVSSGLSTASWLTAHRRVKQGSPGLAATRVTCGASDTQQGPGSISGNSDLTSVG